MITMHSASIPVFVRMLKGARTWIDKAATFAEAKKFDSAVLVQSRLAPDMLPFAKQIQIACDHAKGCASRLAGVDNPKFDDNEATLDELKARIEKTLAFIETFTPAQIDGSEAREIVLPTRNGERKFVGIDYLRHYAIPNFFFHVTTAYAILRNSGVDLGKTDYLSGPTS